MDERANRETPYRRLAINMPESAYSTLERLAASSGMPKNEAFRDLVRTAFGLLEVAVKAQSEGNYLAIVKNARGGQDTEVITLPDNVKRMRYR